MKKLAILLIVLGITFIYNPRTNTGFVYMNDADFNAIIIVDSSTDVLRYYRGVPYLEEKLGSGYENWLRDKINKGLPFKSVIVPYVPDVKKQYEMQSPKQFSPRGN